MMHLAIILQVLEREFDVALADLSKVMHPKPFFSTANMQKAELEVKERRLAVAT